MRPSPRLSTRADGAVTMSDDEAHNTPGGSSWLTSAERHIDRDALLRLQMPPGPAAPQGECEGERNNSRSRLVPLPPRKRSLSAENLLSKTSAPRLSRPQSSPFPLQPPKHTRDDTASQPHSSSSSGFLRALPSSRPPLNGDDAARPPRPPALNGIATLLPPPVPSPGDTRREGGGKDGEELVMRMRSSGVTLEGAGGGGVYRVGQEGTEISAVSIFRLLVCSVEGSGSICFGLLVGQ
ncbi:hypothetical protein T484DRAFT_1911556 [Baffinella frigidus]|nr:hypothetical protein T484DRAFT_1911556 [Cryptophyta sp. CCMP2293]